MGQIGGDGRSKDGAGAVRVLGVDTLGTKFAEFRAVVQAGAGAAESAIASNMLKPELARWS